jgi:hypothetical protein
MEDNDILVKIGTNVENIKEDITNIQCRVSNIENKLDHNREYLDDKIFKKFTHIQDNCINQRNICNEYVDRKLSNKVFFWIIGILTPILVAVVSFLYTIVGMHSEKLAKISLIIDQICDKLGILF